MFMEKKLISKFVTDIFEKKYSNANSTLQRLISEKVKTKIKKTIDDKKNKEKDCDCKKNQKKTKKVTSKR